MPGWYLEYNDYAINKGRKHPKDPRVNKVKDQQNREQEAQEEVGDIMRLCELFLAVKPVDSTFYNNSWAHQRLRTQGKIKKIGDVFNGKKAVIHR